MSNTFDKTPSAPVAVLVGVTARDAFGRRSIHHFAVVVFGANQPVEQERCADAEQEEQHDDADFGHLSEEHVDDVAPP